MQETQEIKWFDPRVGKIPWRRKWQPTPVLLPEKSHEWRSLVGYSPWGHKESDTTERLHFTYYQMGFPDSSVGKKSTCNAGDPWVEKILWRKKRQPTLVLLLGKFHEWRSLVGYSPWSHKELDTTEWLHFSQYKKKKIHPLLKNISDSHKEIEQQIVRKKNILVMTR